MKKVKVVSDYTPLEYEESNFLQLIRDDQGDVHVQMVVNHDSERGVRIASSGTRFSPKVREAFYNLIDAIEVENAQQEKKAD